MRVVYLEHYNPFKMTGGGPTVNRSFITAGREQGHEVKVIAHDSIDQLAEVISDPPDLFILCDIFNEPTSPVHFPLSLIQTIIDNHTFVKMDNAYVDVCSHSYGECLGTGRKCIAGGKVGKALYAKAAATITMSPLHRDAIATMATMPKLNFVLSIPLDNRFQDFAEFNGDRSISHLHVGTINRPKGWYNIKPILLSSPTPLVVGPWRVAENPPPYWRPRVEREALPDIYRCAEVALHHPEWPEPGSLFVREALACGCEIDVNDNVGCLTYDGNELSPKDLWNALSSLA